MASKPHLPWACAAQSVLLAPHIQAQSSWEKGRAPLEKCETWATLLAFQMAKNLAGENVWMKYNPQQPAPPQGCPNSRVRPKWPKLTRPSDKRGNCNLVSCRCIRSCSCPVRSNDARQAAGFYNFARASHLETRSQLYSGYAKEKKKLGKNL